MSRTVKWLNYYMVKWGHLSAFFASLRFIRAPEDARSCPPHKPPSRLAIVLVVVLAIVIDPVPRPCVGSAAEQGFKGATVLQAARA